MENNNQSLEDILRETVAEIIQKMDVEGEIEIKTVSQDDQEHIICNIKTQDSHYLIGQYGVNLQALQHIARVMVRKKTEDRTNFILDVNSYRQEKNDSVMAIANNMASRAIMEGRAVIMRPMSAYERRLVHMELAKNEQVKTESIGEGEDRRVVIKPANLV